MNLNLIEKKIKSNGYYIYKNVFSRRKIQVFKKKITKILSKRLKKKESCGSELNQSLWNYFYEDISLLELIYIPAIDKILKKLLEDNYVLQSSIAQNRLLNKFNYSKVKNKFSVGTTWHADSLYIGGFKVNQGFSYLVIIALDPFTKKTGTQYVSKSHKTLTKPDRYGNYKYKTLKLKQGDICVMDTGMWHKGGEPGSFSRWSVFSIYTCWWKKPYFDYYSYFKKRKKIYNKNYRRLLHFNSIPPVTHNENRGTVTNN